MKPADSAALKAKRDKVADELVARLLAYQAHPPEKRKPKPGDLDHDATTAAVPSKADGLHSRGAPAGRAEAETAGSIPARCPDHDAPTEGA